MPSLIRRILIVDDVDQKQTIRRYKRIFDRIKKSQSELINYDIEYEYESSISNAIDRLNKGKEIFNVIIIDYDFNTYCGNYKGIKLVQEIRKTINKRCKIIFYTMHGVSNILQEEYVELINNDVFRFISKSGETHELKYEFVGSVKSNQVIVEAIIDAIKQTDPISLALENFLIEHYEVLNEYKLNIEGEEYTIQDILDSIRLDTQVGNKFIDGFLESSILKTINFLK